MTRLPDFVVLGQGKAGTSLIYRVLGANPMIGLSEPKELHYFNRHHDKGPDWYAGHFAHLPQDLPLVGEVSPSYLRVSAMERLAALLGPKTKVIFVLRRPIERAYSRYLQNICAKAEGLPFERITRDFPQRMDVMFDQVQACYDLFGADRVLPLFYETNIATSKPDFESRILSFLGLPPADHTPQVLAEGVPNPGVMPRYVYTGQDRLKIRCGHDIFVLPPRQLIFCAQPRNCRVHDDPDTDTVLQAFAQQSRWSPEVPVLEYRMHQRNAVRPLAKRLEQAFGYDMGHWRNRPRQLIYAPAPPPPRLRKR